MPQHGNAQYPLSQPKRKPPAIADLPQPVRTAVIAITGKDECSMVRLGQAK